MDPGLGLKLGVRHGVYRASLPGRGEVRPLEQGLSGERPCFSGAPRLAGVPGLLTVSSQSSASARERIYLPHIVLIRQPSRNPLVLLADL